VSEILLPQCNMYTPFNMF